MTQPAARKRVLSGIQPSGNLHLGNYFGAIRQFVELQETLDCYYFIADYHALTTIQDRDRLRTYTRDVAATYLALGVDPERAVFWRQSDVPEVCELTWLLLTVTGVGLLERAHSYKDKVAKSIRPSGGLFAYPALMAADILAFDTDFVPVGKDQVQHIEMTQDMAASFNAAYGEVLHRPEPRLSPIPRVPGTDWERDEDGAFKRDDAGNRIPQKMSKSYGNTIEIFAEGKALKRTVGGITTDSIPMGEPMNPDDCLVFQLTELFLDAPEAEALRGRYRDGCGYGEVKKLLIAKIDERFGPHRERKRALLADPDYLEDLLRSGAERARAVARATLDRARDASGLGAPPPA